MFLLDDRFIYSPTDIARAECPYAALCVADEKLGLAEPLVVEDAMLERAARLGDAHEARVLAAYRARFGSFDPAQRRGVAEIGDDVERSGAEFRASLPRAREETLAAIAGGADVVFQATFFDGRFYGRADFLLKTQDDSREATYAVVDTKLTEKVRTHALLQMAAYADQLLAEGVQVEPTMSLHHGSGERTQHDLADVLEVYRHERRLLEALLDAHHARGVPASWLEWRGDVDPPELAALGLDALSRRACGRCDYCAREVERHRDTRLISGIRAAQRARLQEVGIFTLDELAGSSGPVLGTSDAVLARLRRQAAMQVGQLERMADAEAAGLLVVDGARVEAPDGAQAPERALFLPLVRAEVVDAAALRALPEPDAGDIYFDFEGDPMWTTSGAMEGGLEYLFGLIEEPVTGGHPAHALDRAPEGSGERYVAFWAHDRAEEKQALVDFLAYVAQRRAQHPGMHVYHYANYEKTALRRLAERHLVGADEVEELITSGVLVDLYPIVKNSAVVSQGSYSIKKLEPLYMGAELRDSGGVTSGGDSVIQYASATLLRADGDEPGFAEIMESIADYNRYDCVSTRRLTLWLRERAAEHGVLLGAGMPDVAMLAEQVAQVAAEQGAADSDSSGTDVVPDAAGQAPGADRAAPTTAPPAPTPGAAGPPAPPAGPGGVEPTPAAPEPGTAEPDPERILTDRLLAAAGPDRDARSADAQAYALLAAALDYHRREELPFWIEHYGRLADPIEWWSDAREVMVADAVEVVTDWTPRASGKGSERVLKMIGLLGSGSSVDAGAEVFLVYAPPLPAGMVAPDGCVRATTYARVVERGISDDGAADVLVVTEGAGRGAGETPAVPMAVAPGAPPPARGIKAAITRLAENVVETLPAAPEQPWPPSADDAAPRPVPDPPRLPAQPGLDVLARREPRLVGTTSLPVVADEDYVTAITAATAALDRSALAVQGPPGTGKTYVGARVVGRLVRELGWRVGVVAQSHAVVEHFLDEVVAAGLEPWRVGKAPQRPRDASGGDDASPARSSWTELARGGYADFLRDGIEGGCVIGGTAWDFTNRSRVEAEGLDLLVVDEAGQFSLANTVATSTAARRLLLLGDPQQLAQVSQGDHAEPIDSSSLAWISGGAEALPPTHGYFIERTWRLHPALCERVSALSYAGALLPQAEVTARRHLDGLPPGVHLRTLRHRGNATSSQEEADEVVAQVRSLLGRTWTDPQFFPASRALSQADVLVVAAYNAQVALVRTTLDAVGLVDVRVGTVDKFQGQEAAVVLVTLAASSSREIPRGVGFLLNRNRLNVAISRGQWAAVVIRSAGLTDAIPSNARALADLGAFLDLCARSLELEEAGAPA
ncbi:conserved hypothetical protein [Beutenbergia cavernae DSM 12333]|uniref:RecB family nuclease n=1 Tax=Beutenbergia cavernae (strain ATCC BAA-8 / DSM 12333 / CCUG 43141 / JCM 11478 / NBRC 16432 / NCIMB 13614 / HKI 0122) TaxID=471853 RepID=C5BVS5_BEUC1|nr:TM0106 family RecB-like putative nuclease [Beutenbergia cavernae]ACQ78515.1 conserved hypothetical protein [Beutenbergia cavernae DSM 12333]